MPSSRRQFLKSLSASALAVVSTKAVVVAESSGNFALQDSRKIGSANFLGNQFLKNSVGITGADCASSIPLSATNSLWIFGDTVEGPFKTIRNLDLTKLRSNTGALVSQQDPSNGIKEFRFLSDDTGNRPRQVVAFDPNENPSQTRIWAVHGVAIGDEIYLFYHRITLLKGVDVFVNFQLNGMGMAKAKIADLEFSRLTAPDGTREFWKGEQPTFGVFVVKAEDYLYLWGSLATGMFLARTRPDKVEELASYEYLVEAPTAARPNASPRWDKTFQPSASLFDSVPNEMSAAYNRHLRKYVAIHSYHRENKIVMRTADSIVGPWSAGEIVYRPKLTGNDDLIYAAKEHPELAQDNGRKIYVSFVNSATYVPQLVEIVFK
jgi:hypothetical protein